MVGTQFPGGTPDRCPVCQEQIDVDPSSAGDAVCPACGSLFWPTRSKDAANNKRRTTLGPYTLVRKLKNDVLRTSYLGRDSAGQLVVLDVLPRSAATSRAFVDRLLNEARVLASLRHPHVAEVLSVDHDHGIYFVAKKYVEGSTVQSWLDELQRIEIGDAFNIARCTAEALMYMHEHEIVHRDIRPQNLWVSTTGHVTVDGFGLANGIHEEVSMTESGTGLGLPLFMAPEQARSVRTVDHRSDIYSLGGMLYYLLSGEVPIQGDSALECIMNKEKGIYAPASSVVSAIPGKVDDLLAQMLASNPNDRFSSAADVIAAIDGLQLAGAQLSFISG